jgi:NADH dehydrogenase FAD-containing subunit
MARIVIIGAGTGGMPAAYELRDALGPSAIIVVTHDEKIIPTLKRLYHIRDGRTVEEKQALAA